MSVNSLKILKCWSIAENKMLVNSCKYLKNVSKYLKMSVNSCKSLKIVSQYLKMSVNSCKYLKNISQYLKKKYLTNIWKMSVNCQYLETRKLNPECFGELVKVKPENVNLKAPGMSL